MVPSPRHRQALAVKDILYLLTLALMYKYGGCSRSGCANRSLAKGPRFQAFGCGRSFRHSPESRSYSGAPGEPFLVPHQLGWGRWVNRGGETVIRLRGFGGCICRSLRVAGASRRARAFSQRSLVGARERIFVVRSALWWRFWGESQRRQQTQRRPISWVPARTLATPGTWRIRW